MTAGPSGPQLGKIAGPTAKMRASGPRARSKIRAAYATLSKFDNKNLLIASSNFLSSTISLRRGL